MGCLFRALIPFIRKVRDAHKTNKEFKWDFDYTWTLILSVFIALFSALVGFSNFALPVDDVGKLKLVSIGFAYGAGLTSVINEISEWIK